ncbi:MAG: PAS domain S-box protein [bacterium]
MKKEIKLLIIEDNEDDVLLLLRYLKKEGYQYSHQRVETPEHLEEALNKERWDIVISDYSLPKFGGREALELFKAKKIDIPFILVSGTVGEDIAVEMMKSGAHDYIMKTQLKRLVPAIERELKEVEIRRDRKNALEALSASEEQYRNLITYMNEGLIRLDLEERIQYVNKRFCDLINYSSNELLGKISFLHLIHPDDRKIEQEKREFRKKGQSNRYELRLIKKNSQLSWVEISAAPMYDEMENIIGSIALITDISKSRIAESALKESEIRYETLAETSPVGIFRTDTAGNTTYLNPLWTKISGRAAPEGLGNKWIEFVHPDDRERVANNWEIAVDEFKVSVAEYRYVRPDNSIAWVMGQAVPERNSNNDIIGYVGTLTDITDRKLAEETLRESEAKFRSIFEQAAVGISFVDLQGYFINVNKKFSSLLGYSLEEIKQKRFQDITFPEDLEADLINMDRILSGQASSYTMDKRYNKKDGSIMWATYTASVLKDKDNVPINIIGIIEDITYRKQIEEELLQSEERFRTMIRGLSDIITVLDLNGNISYQSPSAKNVFGYNSEEVIGRNPIDFIHPDDRKYVANELKEVFDQQNDKRPTSYRLKHKDGHYIHVESVGNNMLGNKAIQGVVLTSREITERLKAEQALRESELRFKELFNNMGNGVAVYEAIDNGSNFVVKDINKAGLKIGKQKKEDLIGKLITDASPGVEKVGLLNVLKNVWITGKSEEFPVIIYKDNAISLWTENYIYKLPSGEVVSVYEDVTEKRKAEEALKISEEKFSKAFVSSPDIVALTTIRDGIFLEVNESFEKITGYRRQDAIGKSFMSFKLMKDKSHLDRYMSELRKKKHISNFEAEFVTRSGQTRVALISSEIINIERTTCLISTLKDITDLKMAEYALAENEKKFRSLFENSQEGIYITDESNIYLDVNAAFLKLFGYERNEIEGMNASVLFGNVEAKYRMSEELYAHGFVNDYEISLIRKDNKNIDCVVTTSLRRDDKGKIIGTQGIIRDVTSRKEFERALIKAKEEAEKADKLKTEFLAQMSHEIRTPINTIFNFVTLIREEVEDALSEDLRESFSIIKRAGKRIIRTIDLILNMSELQTGLFEYSPVKIDLNSVIFDICREYHSIAADKNIALKFEESTQELPVMADEYSVSQIFENLINNAVKYTEKGSIRIVSFLDENKIPTVEVIDTGIGISEEYIYRLFTPFSQEEEGYTRRFEGSGLGLALVKKYCDVNKVAINVESEKEKGSKFTVKFVG